MSTNTTTTTSSAAGLARDGDEDSCRDCQAFRLLVQHLQNLLVSEKARNQGRAESKERVSEEPDETKEEEEEERSEEKWDWELIYDWDKQTWVPEGGSDVGGDSGNATSKATQTSGDPQAEGRAGLPPQDELDKLRRSYTELNHKYESETAAARQRAADLEAELEKTVSFLKQTIMADQVARQRAAEEIRRVSERAAVERATLQRKVEELKAQPQLVLDRIGGGGGGGGGDKEERKSQSEAGRRFKEEEGNKVDKSTDTMQVNSRQESRLTSLATEAPEDLDQKKKETSLWKTIKQRLWKKKKKKEKQSPT